MSKKTKPNVEAPLLESLALESSADLGGTIMRGACGDCKCDDKVPAIYTSMAAIHEELGAVKKDKKGFNYNFRGVDDAMNALNPLMKKHKVIIRRDNLQINRSTRTVTDRYNKTKEIVDAMWQCDYIFTSLIDGSEIRTQGGNEGSDTSNGDKAVSCATSNAFKYVIYEMFVISTQDQKDSDTVTAEENNVDNKSRGKGYRKNKDVKKSILD